MKDLYAAFSGLSEEACARVLTAICESVLTYIAPRLDARRKAVPKNSESHEHAIEPSLLKQALEAARRGEAETQLEEQCLVIRDLLDDDEMGLDEETELGIVAILNVFEMYALGAGLHEEILLEQALQCLPKKNREQAFRGAMRHAS